MIMDWLVAKSRGQTDGRTLRARTAQRRNSWREENLTLAVFAMEESLIGWFLKLLRIMGGRGNKCKILVNRVTKNVPKEKKKCAPAFTLRTNKKQKKIQR